MEQSQSKTKKIGIDARFFGAKDKGFGRYTENLIRNLEIMDLQGQYFIFLRQDSWDKYQPQNSNFQKVLADYKWYGIKEQIFFPLKLKKYNLDLVHFTHFNVPIFYRGKFIVTIHDLTLRHFPTHKRSLKNFIFYPFKKIAYLIVFRHAIKNSEKIIAISNYTKQEILKYYRVNPDKIKVIYEGAPEIFRHSMSKDRTSDVPYLLYVGNDYPHKNLERLKLAFEKLKRDGLNCELVLITKFVSEEELDNLYKNASAFVFPSLSEGFGLPPLEAMARGVPVVSSNATCLPEVLGDAVIYFDPLDVDDMAEKIKKALLDEDLRKDLIAKGFEQIKKYSWQKMAEETLNLYRFLG